MLQTKFELCADHFEVAIQSKWKPICKIDLAVQSIWQHLKQISAGNPTKLGFYKPTWAGKLIKLESKAKLI